MPIENKEEAKNQIIEHCKKGAKTKFYFNDITKIFPDSSPRDVKKLLTELVNEEKMEFWSSGSTTLYGLKGAGKQAEG